MKCKVQDIWFFVVVKNCLFYGVAFFRFRYSASDEAMLRELVQDSVDSKPILYDLQAKNQLFTIGIAVKDIENSIADFKAKYIKQYSEPMVSFCSVRNARKTSNALWMFLVFLLLQNNNPLLQAKSLLWVWFLTEPKMVLKALKSVTIAAKETTKRAPSRSTKAISGIIRKIV